MPGTRIFTYANIAPETVRGTPIAPTRQLYMDGSWTENLGLRFHEAENKGLRTRSARQPTQTTEDVTFSLKTIDGVSYDDLVYALAALNGTATGVGGGADKTWTQTIANTGSNSPKSFTLDLGDDTQNWRLQYAMWQSIKLSSAKGGLTDLSLDGFAQRAIKTAKATPVTNAGVKIPGDLWTIKFAATLAGLGAASIVANFLLDWELEISTGLKWRHYMDGNLYGAQHVETDLFFTLKMTVESTAQAVTEFYDKWKAQTLDFIRLKATGPTLGASNYSSQLDLPCYFDEPDPISGEDDGVNLYTVTAHGTYDPTSAAALAPVTVNSLAAL
jgi:hypothetical protein